MKDVAIVGVGESAIGKVPGRSSLALHADAALAALDDAGLTIEDIDGLLTNDSHADFQARHSIAVAEYIGLAAETTRYIRTVKLGSGASSGAMLYDAAVAIAAGQAETILIVSADNTYSGMTRQNYVAEIGGDRDKEFEAPYGTLTPGLYAMIAQRHMFDYGTTSEQLAQVAVSTREWANRTPNAHMKGVISVDDVLKSRMIASPFHLFDCSPVSDGGCALIVTSTERAKRFRGSIRVAGSSMVYGSGVGRVHHSLSQMASIYTIRESTAIASRRALEEAGMERSDVDIMYCYDPFTIYPIIFLEGLGFTNEGEGGRFVVDRGIGPDGDLPVNTHGGLLSYCHPGYPGGMFMFIEAVRQLRGAAAGRQVPDADTAILAGYGSQHQYAVTTVLSTQS